MFFIFINFNFTIFPFINLSLVSLSVVFPDLSLIGVVCTAEHHGPSVALLCWGFQEIHEEGVPVPFCCSLPFLSVVCSSEACIVRLPGLASPQLALSLCSITAQKPSIFFSFPLVTRSLHNLCCAESIEADKHLYFYCAIYCRTFGG